MHDTGTLLVTRYWGQKPVQKTLYGRMHKINHLDDILRCEDETLKIVEAIAEHDFCSLRLIVTFSAKEFKQYILRYLPSQILYMGFYPGIFFITMVKAPAGFPAQSSVPTAASSTGHNGSLHIAPAFSKSPP